MYYKNVQILWLPCKENCLITTDMPEELRDIQVQNLMIEGQRKWDVEVLQDFFNERESNLIQQIPLSTRNI